MKERLSVYLDPQVMRSLIDYARRRGKSKSLVAEAAIASFLSRHTERLERHVRISVEALALFVRFWLMATPALPEQNQATARAKGAERYQAFVDALGRRLSKGTSLLREVSLDLPAAGESDLGGGLAQGDRES